jgi:hypothetical protein
MAGRHRLAQGVPPAPLGPRGAAGLGDASLPFSAVYHWTGHHMPAVGRCIVRQTVKSGVPSSIGIAIKVGMPLVMENSGMIHILGSISAPSTPGWRWWLPGEAISPRH